MPWQKQMARALLKAVPQVLLERTRLVKQEVQKGVGRGDGELQQQHSSNGTSLLRQFALTSCEPLD